MPFTRSHHQRTTGFGETHHHGFFSRHHPNPDRRAAGYKAALSNPNTTHAGRERAKAELHAMGRSDEAHVPLKTRVAAALGIHHTTPRRTSPRRTGGYSRRHRHAY